MKKAIAAIVILAAGVAIYGCGGQGALTVQPCVPGMMRTLAGNGQNGFSGDGGYALQASLSLPQDTLTAPDGTVYVIDWNNHRIRSVTTDGIIHHVAGRGELGGTIDDHSDNPNADFNHPTALLFDPTGLNLLIAAWHNSKVKSIAIATGIVSNLYGDGRRGYFGDGAAAATASFDLPTSIAYDPSGNLMVMDEANQVIRWIDSGGIIHKFAGQCIIDDAASGGPCATPVACPAPSGKFTCGDPSTTCATKCNPGYAGDEGPASAMRMNQPFGQSAIPGGRLAYDKAGNLYFPDTGNSIIRMIDKAGVVHRFAGTAPSGGVLQFGYGGDGGPALSAKLNSPVDLAFADDGTLYFTDVYNHCVRKIATDGTISTAAGICGQPGYTGDGGPPAKAQLRLPFGVEWTKKGINIADTGNSVIRQICPK